MIPSGLLSHASSDLIFVALNYRLGALGFLSDPASPAPNPAYLDQRLALAWVQENIHLFGGDPNRVTAMGESGGGGSIILQMAAEEEMYGPTPFARAVVQSPAFIPTGQVSSTAYDDFLETLNVETMEEARDLSEEEVIRANAQQIGKAPATTYTFGNTLNSFSPQPPATMLKSAKFNTSIPILAGHNSFEGSFFFDPSAKSDEAFSEWVSGSIAGLEEDKLRQLVEEIYPAVFDGSYGYGSWEERGMRLWAEAFIDCNFQGVNEALGGKGYGCKFAHRYHFFAVLTGLVTDIYTKKMSSTSLPGFTLKTYATPSTIQNVPFPSRRRKPSYRAPL